jgi:hypothetical protein
MKKFYTSIKYKKQNAQSAIKSFKRRLASEEKRKILRRFISGNRETEHIRQ